MVFKLTRDEINDRDRRADNCRSAATELESAIAAYNETLAERRAIVQTALDLYNDALGELRGFCEDFVSRIDAEYGDKSEKWQKGDRAQEVESWKSDWEGVDLDDVEVEFPDDLELPSIDHAGEVCNLPEEPN